MTRTVRLLVVFGVAVVGTILVVSLLVSIVERREAAKLLNDLQESPGTASVDDIERYYDEIQFSDWTHGETKAPMVKIQHPEFELFSTGIHARAGVACADCHMPYERVGATKVSSHWVSSPRAHINTSCLSCRRQTEVEMRERELAIQDRPHTQMQRAEAALLAAMDQIKAAVDADVPDGQLVEVCKLYRRAELRWDFISAENSMGFHSPQEAVRVLGESADFARQAQFDAYLAMIGFCGPSERQQLAVAGKCGQ